MTALEVPRMQALVGLSIMSLCTLAFHACSRSIYTTHPPNPSLSWPTTQGSNFAPSEFTTIMAAIESLSQSITEVNTSLHHEFSLLQKVGTWGQRQNQIMGPNDGVIAADIVLVALWIVGMAVTCNGMYNLSQPFLLRVLLMAVWCANLGLLCVVLGTEGRRWYVYVLATVWPMQVVMGLKIWMAGEKEVVSIRERVGEKEKEKEREKGEKKSGY
ncbi:uncharacterized protein PAC_09664 [Phialocephala subalpina]|uniref:Uncharacterized protein n=1 Tax=Phialocephala subalpina TaxID=576137 RepID=A0A1L7X416_9HELO|nr:uncharacterized protein PAC_09664 [Phialocephala subalpina]